MPLVYLVVTLGALQGASYAAEGAARQAARMLVTATSDAAGRAAAAAAARTTLADWHIPVQAADLEISCAPDPTDCATPRGTVSVRLRIAVALPGAPPALELHAPGTITVQADAVQQVSHFHPADARAAAG